MKKGTDINISDLCKVRNRYYHLCLVERGNKTAKMHIYPWWNNDVSLIFTLKKMDKNDWNFTSGDDENGMHQDEGLRAKAKKED